MAFYKVLCVLLVFSVAALANWFEETQEERGFEDEGDEEERALVMEFRRLRERRIEAFECNKLGESCRGLVPCCGDTHCYWKDGHSLRTAGQCVTCIQSNQICQRDKQCCSGLVCQKAQALYTDGRCDNPRPAGGSCHENDQCASKNCNRTAWQKVTFKEGKCA